MSDREGIRHTILHLIGAAGTGKFTIAKEIAQRAPFRVIDNHLVSNPVFSVLDLDGRSPIPHTVRTYTDRIWRVVLDAMLHLSRPEKNFIFTNVLLQGHDDDRQRLSAIRDLARARGSRYIPVRLYITDIAEHKKRITCPARLAHMKTTDPVMAETAAREAVIAVDDPLLLDLDVTHLSAGDAAEKILQHVVLKH